MLESVPPRAEGVGHSARKNFVQCSQCTEHFPRYTKVCPRCSRKNERSPWTLAVRIIALVIFAFTLNWVVKVVANGVNPIPAERSPMLEESATTVVTPAFRF